jgi:hypothetical protein
MQETRSENESMRQTQRRGRGAWWEGETAVRVSYCRPLLPITDDRVGGDVNRSEPPGTDPYAGWCVCRELITAGYPVGLIFE